MGGQAKAMTLMHTKKKTRPRNEMNVKTHRRKANKYNKLIHDQ